MADTDNNIFDENELDFLLDLPIVTQVYEALLPVFYAVRDFVEHFTGSAHVLTIGIAIGLPCLLLLFTALRRIFGGECTRMTSFWSLIMVPVIAIFFLAMLSVSDGTTFEWRVGLGLARDGLLLGLPLMVLAYLLAWILMPRRPDHCEI